MVSPAGSGRSVSDASVGTLGAVAPCDKTCWVEGTLPRAAGDGAVTAPTTCNPSGATSRLAGSRPPAGELPVLPQQRTSLDRPGWTVTCQQATCSNQSRH